MIEKCVYQLMTKLCKKNLLDKIKETKNKLKKIAEYKKINNLI